MTLNQTIIYLLTQITKFATPKLNSCLKIDQIIQLEAHTQILAEITSNQILLNNVNISDKLNIKQKSATKPLAKNVDLLLEKIGPNITALNHLGVSYQVNDINQEIDQIRQLISGTSWHLYEEKSSVKSARWFFVGDRQNWREPLFKIVLNQPDKKEESWYPHFQIDIDTNLSFKELDQITSNFFDQKVVNYKCRWFLMFVIGEVQGVKIALGIGTSARRPEKQRQNLFVWS